MFAVDHPEPGGMLPDELVATLRAIIGTGRCVGLEITNYDPERDRQHLSATRLVDALVRALEPLTVPVEAQLATPAPPAATPGDPVRPDADPVERS
jgi:hypothetical protein